MNQIGGNYMSKLSDYWKKHTDIETKINDDFSLNRLISVAFSNLLGLLHFAVLGTLGYLIYLILKKHDSVGEFIFSITGDEQLANIITNSANDKAILIILLISLIYVIVVGLISTFAAINENMERANKRMDRICEHIVNTNIGVNSNHEAMNEIKRELELSRNELSVTNASLSKYFNNLTSIEGIK